MKINLTEEEVHILPYLISKGLGKHVFKAFDDLNIEDFFSLASLATTILPSLEKKGFLKVDKIKLNTEGYAEDIFLNRFLTLLKEKKLTEAGQLAKLCNLEILMTLHNQGLPMDQISNLGEFPHVDSAYGKDLCWCMLFEIEILVQAVDFVAQNLWNFSQKKTTERTPADCSTHFDAETSILFVRGSVCKIRKYSKQFEFLQVIFSNPDNDWQLSEIAEKIDLSTSFKWKVLYNHCNALKSKIAAEAGIKDFFISTTQSVKINPKYIKKIGEGDDWDNLF